MTQFTMGRGTCHWCCAAESCFRQASGITAVFFTRSPEVAAYWANMWGREMDQFCGGILILNRTSLVQSYRLEPSSEAEDWKYDEREENVLGPLINIRRHLLGVVRQADVDAILGPPRHRFFPNGYLGWSDRKKQVFWKEEKRLAREIVREGRAKVREIIVQQRGRIGASDRQPLPWSKIVEKPIRDQAPSSR